MPKHRQPGFAVVREKENYDCAWEFNGIIGVYHSVQRAEEVAAATIQRYYDLGMSQTDPDYRCTVHPTNWYDE